MSKLYNELAAINHVKALAFNRHASTKGEKKCLNYITQELKKENINPTIESFEWAKTFTLAKNLFFIFVLLYMLITQIILLFPSITWALLPLNISFFLLSIFGAKYLFDCTQMRFIGKKKKAKNLIINFQGKNIHPKRPVIIFSAHHDTASRRYPMRLSINLYKLMALLFFTFYILIFFISIWSLLTIISATQFNRIYFFIRNLIIICGISGIILVLIIISNKKSDNSIGSIDNASGVAVLIELAKLVKKHPLNKTDVIFLWCGAEERGLWGSKHYCNKHFEELNQSYDLDKSYNINIDMIGAYIGLLDKLGLIKRKRLNKNLNNVLEASANMQNITIKKESVKIGAGASDHVIFRAYAKKYHIQGFQVSFFSSDDDIKYIHSKHDTPDKCSAKNLNDCIEICYNAIKSLDLRVERNIFQKP